MKKTVLAVALATFGVAMAAEWNFPAGGDPKLVVPHGPETTFTEGVRAEIDFSIDISKISPTHHFANLFTKGKDFMDGFSVMVRDTGRMLVDVKGIEPGYYLHCVELESNRAYHLVMYITRDNVRLFLDGNEAGSYLYYGAFDFSTTAPLTIGSMGGYTFPGSVTHLKLEPLAAVNVPPGGPGRLLVEPPTDQARAKILWSRAICRDRGRYVGWPTVCRLRNGDILAVFSGDREEHVCPWGKVQMARSRDGGETWEGPTTIANGPVDDRDAGIVQMPDGDIVVTYFTSVAYRTESFLKKDWPRDDPHYWWKRHDEKISDETRSAALGYFRTVSKDDGKTWSKPTRMEGVGNAPHGPVLLRDGSLFQLGITGIKRKTPDGEKSCTAVGAWKSADKGATWQCLCPDIPWSDDEGLKNMELDEPHVVELADGTLVGMIRFNGADQYLRQTVSADGGKTWTRIVKTPLVGLPPHLIRLADGKLVCVYARRISAPCYGEYACISDDDGKTWDVANEILLRPYHNYDIGYPSSCLLPNGDILTVFYHPRQAGEKPCLMATKWRVKSDDGLTRLRAAVADDPTCCISNAVWTTIGGKKILDIEYVLKPGKDSHIRCKAAFPAPEDWNGRLWGHGQGGWAGAVGSQASAATGGALCVSTDLGTGPSCGWRTHAPDPWPEDVWKDYLWRSTHLMTVYAKKFAKEFYGREPHHSYFIGASTGGGQGMHEAERFPEDYDGIVSELPAIGRLSIEASAFHRSQIDNRIRLAGKRAKILADAAVEFMADKDEPFARGRFITDPRLCDGHDDEILNLAAKKDPAFAEPAVRAAVKELFAGPVVNGRRTYPGYVWGAEFNHSGGLICFSNYIEKRDGKKFDEHTATWNDFEEFTAARRGAMDAMNPDLSAFAAHGGKIIMTAGLEDQTVPYLTMVDYYEDVTDEMGGLARVKNFFRLFLMPGCAHGDVGREMRSCPPADLKRMIENWCEKGEAPDFVEPKCRDGTTLRVAAYPEKAVKEGDAWTTKPFPRGVACRTDPFYAGGRQAKTVLAFNEDDTHFFGRKEAATREGLEGYIDQVCRGAVTHFFICANGQRAIFDSKTIDSAWKDTNEPKGYEANLKALADQGLDPIRIWAEKCRRKGVVPWVSIRMNDIHCVNEPANPYLSSFWRNHPELWRGGQKDGQHGLRAFDYSKKEVRDYFLAFVKEVIDRYECAEGIELDWLRFPDHLPPGRARENAHFLTGFMRDVRACANAAAEKRGWPMRVSVRVATVPENALGYGTDALAWARAGLVDLIVPHNYRYAPDYGLPLTRWAELVAAANPRVRVIPGCDASIKIENLAPDRKMNLDEYCAWADVMQARGAKGLYLFNLYENPPDCEVWNEILDHGLSRGYVAKHRRRYPLSYLDTPGGNPSGRKLPAAIDSDFAFTLPVGTVPAAGTTALLLAFDGNVPPGTLEGVTLNGAKAESVADEPAANWVNGYKSNMHTVKWKDLPQYRFEVPQVKKSARLAFPLAAVKAGANEVRVKGAPGVPAKLICCELEVEPK